jgi:predicted amidohydrolase YtcJ
MTPEEAVRGYTSWAAWAAFEEGEAGVLAPGMRADLTALSVDPLRLVAPAELLTGSVRLTVVGGRVVR